MGNSMDWTKERDEDGNPTPLAIAAKAIEEHGCDCDAGCDLAHTCLAGLCEIALFDERNKLEVANQALAEARARHKAYMDQIEPLLAPDRARRPTGEPADPDWLEIKRLRERAKAAEAEVERLRRERDEARNDWMEKELKFSEQQARAEAAERERDEAREGMSYWENEASVRLNTSLDVAARVKELEAAIRKLESGEDRQRLVAEINSLEDDVLELVDERDKLQKWVAGQPCEDPITPVACYACECDAPGLSCIADCGDCEPCQARAAQGDTDAD